MEMNREFTASEVREILVRLFPHRRCVLSQLTLFSQMGIAKPSGVSVVRKRTCYVLADVLNIACIFDLKERGISLSEMGDLPAQIRNFASTILFDKVPQCIAAGFGNAVSLDFGDRALESLPMKLMLEENSGAGFFWSYDVTSIAKELLAVATSYINEVDILVGQDILAQA